ncbi:WhiB family transcriptional regulator [Ilumatobacter sp.]|uniref:WhiB family transcriptional regulator n=1 Tax=Ilumatobacter sp. TaxID=1967498 RepID=UPI003B52D805
MTILDDLLDRSGREPEPLPPDRPPPEPAELELEEVPGASTRAPAARCADGNGTLSGLFFSDDLVDVARAKAMCSLCPLSTECLAGALEREEPWGVWGGELLSGGRIVANKRPCGRPPKVPRPEITYDEMGPVGVVA